MPNKKLLILTGPQGSGNHLWSKIFALHPKVFGWRALLDTYWIGHHNEPFSLYWKNPDLLHAFDWDKSNYFVTSISCPYIYDKKPNIPNYFQFFNIARLYCDTTFVIIGRDKNILEKQEERVRGEKTYDKLLQEIKNIRYANKKFISTELLYLYKQEYLKTLNDDFPIDYTNSMINEILKQDPNKKYISNVEAQPLDNEVIKAYEQSKR